MAVADPEPLKPGDLLLCRSNGLVGALIRFGERLRVHGWATALRRTLTPAEETPDDPSWCNHVAVYVGDGSLIEALADGLNRTPLDRYKADSYRVARLAWAAHSVGPFERQDLVTFAETQLARHDRYGWLSIASIVVQLLTPIRLDVSWDGALTCSGFAAQCWEHAGVTLATRSSLTTMPSDFWPYTTPPAPPPRAALEAPSVATQAPEEPAA